MQSYTHTHTHTHTHTQTHMHTYTPHNTLAVLLHEREVIVLRKFLHPPMTLLNLDLDLPLLGKLTFTAGLC